MLCGIPQLSETEREGYSQVPDRLGSALAQLDNPERRSSIFTLLDRDGRQTFGISDPRRPE